MAKYNQSGYLFYVLLDDKVLESGWEYKDDAIDQIENIVSEQKLTVRSKFWLRNNNINPNLNKFWLETSTKE